MHDRVAVIGAGSWGSALAKTLAEKGFDVLMWSFEKEVAEGINSVHRNPLYLKDIELPPSLRATNDPARALSGRTLVVSALPSNRVRSLWEQLARHLGNDSILVSATKGIEAATFKPMSQVLEECLAGHSNARIAVISGPSFAREVALGLPTSVVVASRDPSTGKAVQDAFRTDRFLTFTNSDVVGVEVGGAVKNVIAIAAGMSDGLMLGHNARAAIITRGLYEMIKIGVALGASPLTFAGLSGIGDLVLTCTGELSRNHTVGQELGRGRDLKGILADMRMVAEGIPTAEALHRLTSQRRINAPICEEIYRVLYEGKSPERVVSELCSMPLKEELGSIIKFDIGSRDS